MEAFTEATLLGRRFLAHEYRGMKDTSYNLMKCLDLFHSAALNKLADRYFAETE